MNRHYIEAAEFSPARRGYDSTEVRVHLQRVAEEFERLAEERDAAIAARESGMAFVAREASEEVRRIIDAAGQGGMELRVRAEQEADKVRAEAEVDATALLEGAERHAAERVAAAEAAGRRAIAQAKSFVAEVTRFGDAWCNAGLQIEQLNSCLTPLKAVLATLEDGLGESRDAEPAALPKSAPTTSGGQSAPLGPLTDFSRRLLQGRNGRVGERQP
ncbi:MAG: DivIVA domain-containing protein [Actinobacteria bacterium]|nr:DivIVA domain-containing protein [Actinomycetota bacterium]